MTDGILSRVGALVLKKAARESPEGASIELPVKNAADRIYVYGIITDLRRSGFHAELTWTSSSLAKIHTKMVNHQ